jgi:hypothetical protein
MPRVEKSTELAVDALDQRPPRSSAIADDSPR